MDYSEYSLRERYKLAAARLRYAETEHYRASLEEDDDPESSAASNKKKFEAEITKIRDKMGEMDREFQTKKIKKPDLVQVTEGDLPAVMPRAPLKKASHAPSAAGNAGPRKEESG